MSIKFANKERFFKRLISVVPEAEKELTEANRKSAEAMVAMAQRLVPVATGTLRDSIRMSAGERPTSFVVEAGGKATTKGGYDYSLSAEFGNVNSPASPFFYPSFRASKKPAKSRATRALRKAIKNAGFGTT